jgi:hypothetical protein
LNVPTTFNFGIGPNNTFSSPWKYSKTTP